jgi:putative tryptophan/tyrosine transport system substrate-binding protein
MQFGQLKRREFITLLGGAAVGWPLAARAQQPAIPVIGFLDPRSPEMIGADRLRAFRQGLRQTGYVEGQNVTIEYRWAHGQDDRLLGLAADLASRQVGVIIADALSSALAAKAATTTIPIVFMMGDDPVKFGLAASYNRPGGNVTGVSFLTPALDAKRIELLHELVPKATAFAVLENPKSTGIEIRLAAAQAAATALGLQLSIINASSEREIEAAFLTIVERRADALLVASDPFFFGRREQLATLSTRHAIPAVYFSRDFVTAGGLMSYGTNISDAQRLSGIYAGEILKGAKASDLPVMQPTKFELVINLKTAKALGLTVPLTLQLAADEVIE